MAFCIGKPCSVMPISSVKPEGGSGPKTPPSVQHSAQRHRAVAVPSAAFHAFHSLLSSERTTDGGFSSSASPVLEKVALKNFLFTALL